MTAGPATRRPAPPRPGRLLPARAAPQGPPAPAGPGTDPGPDRAYEDGPRRPYDLDRCVHHLFEAQARRTPEAVALVAEAAGEELTYAELDARANRLAHLLRSQAAGPEALVGVLLDRSTALVTALLAILKAGAGYVPLDPEHPPLRTAEAIKDSGAALVVTDAAHAAAVTAAGARPVRADAVPGGLPATAPDVAADPDGAAYALFTSGSTGRPKAVVVPHRGVVNRLLWMRDDCGLAAGSRVLQKTPATFDVSVWEFFGTLAVGATLVLARPGGHRDPAYLRRLLAERAVDTAHFVPSMLRAFLAELRDHPEAGPPPALRRIVCSGEALTPDLVDAVAGLIGCELLNLYGPTEASVDVTAVRCLSGRPVTIGRPVANTRVYVLGPDGRRVPTGVAGELCLAGVQLARGYLGRPALTAAAFRPDPYGPPGARLYRTGDLARWTPDGEIEYLGRLDHQVKIRGVRIELGEVEAAMTAHPQVHAAVAAAADGRLAGYVVGTAPGLPPIADLRDFLAARLPAAMVPSLWTRLPALPLTPSGKTDRKALPAPGTSGRPEGAGPYRPPRTPAERALAAVWEEVLGLAPVGSGDRFLDLGGDSLAAARVCSRLRAAGVAVEPADLLAAPGLAALAAGHGAAQVRTAAPAALIPPRPPGPVPLSSQQQRLWFLDRMYGGSAYTMYDAHRLRGPLDEGALRAALRSVVARHAALRTTFATRRGIPYQVIHPDLPADVTTVDLTGAGASADSAADRDRLTRAALETCVARPFELDRGPLLRLLLVTVADDHHVLALVVHHIVADDWSMDVLWRDLCAAYRGTAASGLSEPPAEYADYAAWQQDPATRGAEQAALGHWLDRLRGAPVLALPADGARPPVGGRVSRRTAFGVPAPVAGAVRRRAAALGATPFMALLAGYCAVLARTTGQRDLVVGTFSAGRRAAELDGTVGLFVNTLALRTTVDPDEPWARLLARVRRTALAAYRHEQVPFDQVVAALAPPRDPTRNPVAQAAFQVLGPLDRRVDLPGVTAEPYAQGQGGQPFDVTVTMRERGSRLDGELHLPAGLLPGTDPVALAAAFTRFAADAAARPGLPVRRLG